MSENDKPQFWENLQETLNTPAGHELLKIIDEHLKSQKKLSETFTEARRKITFSNQIIYLVIIVICLATIIFLGSNKVIDNTATGTLLGAIIGYIFGKTDKGAK